MGAHLSFQYNDNTHLAGVLEMVRRGCERLYALNASTAAEKVRNAPVFRHPKMTNSQIDEATLLARAGKNTVTEIAQIIGHTQSATHKLLVVKLGFKGLPNGRGIQRPKVKSRKQILA